MFSENQPPHNAIKALYQSQKESRKFTNRE